MSRRVYAVRAGRIVGGMFGAVAALVFGIVVAFSDMRPSSSNSRLFLIAWPIGLASGTVAFVAAWLFAQRGSGRLENQFDVAGRAYAMEVRSISWPLTALVLLFPLTVQYLVLDALNTEYRFGYWTRLWFLTTAHCHLVLIYFSRRIARGVPSFSRFALRAWVVTTASALPSAWLFSAFSNARHVYPRSIGVPAVYMVIAGMFALGIVPIWYFARMMIDAEREDIAKTTAFLDSPERLKTLILDERVDENARIIAMYTLARTRGKMHVFPVLDQAMLKGSPALSAAALDLAQHLRYRPEESALRKMLAHEARRTVIVACEVAASARLAELERLLIRVLATATPKDDTEMAVAAITALGTCGTASAVEVLWQVQHLRWISTLVKEAAELASQRIKSREQLAGDGGELSLASGEVAAGAVSFAAGEAGGLSKLE